MRYLQQLSFDMNANGQFEPKLVRNIFVLRHKKYHKIHLNNMVFVSYLFSNYKTIKTSLHYNLNYDVIAFFEFTGNSI